MSGRYAPDFEAPESLEEVISYTLSEPEPDNSSINEDFKGSATINNGVAFLADTSVRRVAYDGTTEWESGSSSAIDDGVAVGANTVVVSTHERLIGYDRESGEEQWVREGGLPLIAEDGILFSVSEGTITKSDLETGDMEWEATPEPESTDELTEEFYGIASGDYRLIRCTSDHIIALLRNEQYGAGDLDDRYGWVAIERGSGENAWVATGYEDSAQEAHILDGYLVAHYGNSSDMFRVFSLDTGEETAAIEYEHSMPDYPRRVGYLTSDGDKIFTRSDEAILAYDLDDGTLAWESLMPSEPSQAIACTDDTVYCVVGQQIRTLDTSTGEETGQYNTTVGDIDGIVLAGDHILALDLPIRSQTEFTVTGYGPAT